MLQRKTVDTATLELLIDLLALESLQDFSLGGGTALALKFGHRNSVDLDLFTTQPFDTEEVISAIHHKFKYLSVLNMNRNSLSLSVQGVKVDILSHQYALLEPPEIIESVRFLSTQDIAAMKLSAVAQRGSKKDFFDLIELLNHYSLPQLLAFYGQKYNEDNYFYVLKSMTYFQDAEDEPSPVILNNTTWENVKDSISQAVENQTKTKGSNHLMKQNKKEVETYLGTSIPKLLVQLTPEQKPLWGMMTPQHMVEHLIVVYKLSMGRFSVPVVSKEEDWPKLKEYLMKDSPMRRNVPAPNGKSELQPLRFVDLEEAKQKFIAETETFLKFCEAQPEFIANHPYGGPLTTQEWLFCHIKHIKHHLIQFELIPDYE